jgi:glycosyltransferase involved in cell wall biosynthesis
MNIVYVHQHFSTTRGHTGTRSYDFARYLVERGHRVTVVAGVYGASDLAEMALERVVTRRTVDGIDLRIVNIRHDNRQPFWRRIAAFLAFMLVSTVEVLRVRDADVVFATSTPLTAGFPGAIAWWLRRVPFVFEVRDIWPETAVEVGALRNHVLIWAAGLAERAFYRAASRIVVISQRMAERLRARLGPAADKVVVIPLGSDCAMFDAAAPDTAWRRTHGLEGKFVAVYAGAHGRVNALGWVLKAAALLRDDPAIRIVLIGQGALKASLMAQARQDGLDNVLWLDPLPKKALAGVLKACDLGLMTLENLSIFDTACPNKFMDYLAAGLPVLVNFDGEAGWVCRREGCGFVVPPEDVKSMAGAIRDLAADPARCREMARRAQALAASRFDRRRLVEQIEAILGDAAGARPVDRQEG